MKALEEHTIGMGYGSPTILGWVENHKYRNYASFPKSKQLDFALKIASIEDKDARELMLDILHEATKLQEVAEEMHKEFDTLFTALTRINDSTKDEEVIENV